MNKYTVLIDEELHDIVCDSLARAKIIATGIQGNYTPLEINDMGKATDGDIFMWSSVLPFYKARIEENLKEYRLDDLTAARLETFIGTEQYKW